MGTYQKRAEWEISKSEKIALQKKKIKKNHLFQKYKLSTFYKFGKYIKQ